MKFTIRTKNCRETKTPITGTGPSLKEISKLPKPLRSQMWVFPQFLGTYRPFGLKKEKRKSNVKLIKN